MPRRASKNKSTQKQNEVKKPSKSVAAQHNQHQEDMRNESLLPDCSTADSGTVTVSDGVIPSSTSRLNNQGVNLSSPWSRRALENDNLVHGSGQASVPGPGVNKPAVVLDVSTDKQGFLRELELTENESQIIETKQAVHTDLIDSVSPITGVNHSDPDISSDNVITQRGNTSLIQSYRILRSSSTDSVLDSCTKTPKKHSNKLSEREREKHVDTMVKTVLKQRHVGSNDSNGASGRTKLKSGAFSSNVDNPTNKRNRLIGVTNEKQKTDKTFISDCFSNAKKTLTSFIAKAEDEVYPLEDLQSLPSVTKQTCTKAKSRSQSWNSNSENTVICWWAIFFVLTAWSFGSHLYNIERPAHVCWDETHFGKMGGWYITREFFFDVHPPLGKMLIGLSGYLTGYNGNFSFDKPGLEYNETKYVGMRVFCGLLGSSLPVFAYGSVWEMTHSLSASTLTGLFFAFDTGVLTLTRYILLDAPLLFFIFGAIFSMLKFLFHESRPYSIAWWGWLTSTGVFLACAISVKFVGLFVVLYVGYTTAMDLWRILGNLKLSILDISKHVVARVACLIILPLSLYVMFYAIHFAVLNKSGPGDGHFSSVFQSGLQGNPLHNASQPANIAYGSKISIKNYRTGGGYLHSHWHLFPEEVGARQQQVTTYGHKDYNNHWVVKQHDSQPNTSHTPELLRNGDIIRLEHWQTKRNLHSHHVSAPITKSHYQVTAYGENGQGDANDIFRIEVPGMNKGELILTMRSTFYLVHVSIGCVLHSHKKQLPKWAYEQMEVTCNPNTKQNINNLWHVEMVMDERLTNISFSIYAPSFLEKFYESHVIQMQGNSGLKPKDGEDTSQPWEWPINYRGLYFSGGNYRIYLLGNPVIWWGVPIVAAIYMIVFTIQSVQRQRGVSPSEIIGDYETTVFQWCSWLFVGWLLHFFPFWTMGRVLYFHHYFPALMFSFMFAGIAVDYLIARISLLFSPNYVVFVWRLLYGATIAGIMYSFVLFHPLVYGASGPLSHQPNGTMKNLKWLSSWDF